MLSDELRRRLEELNRAPLPRSASASRSKTAPGVAAPVIPVVRPKLSFHAGDPGVRRPYLLGRIDSDEVGDSPPSVLPRPADELGEECLTASGSHVRIRRSLAEFWPTGAARIADACSALSAKVLAEDAHQDLKSLAGHFPQSVLLLDLETCGFAGSMVFLVGLLWKTSEGFVIDQLLARNYAEESSVLEATWQLAAQQHALVTFNGKSFDWPMVLDRTTRFRGRPVPSAAAPRMDQTQLRRSRLHCDLLHHARRRWKGELPNCKLQTLERYICRRRRSDDIPGSAIPLAYHEYVRTGNTRELRSILHHNALDLVTLLEIAIELLQAPEKFEQAG